MNILLLGSGAREHAMAWKIAQSSQIDQLYIAPGNPGTQEVGINLDIKVSDFNALGQFCLENNVSMVVVGSEEPLVLGVYDFFQQERFSSIAVIGPSQNGSKLEGSKDFAKEFMMKHNIPTAKYFTVTNSNLKEGLDYLELMQAPYVLKADGLAAGKGVLILNDINEAREELQLMIEGKFGNASSKVVIEEFLSGIELSVFVMFDGNDYKILPEAKDYKRVGEADSGLNTGGMGAVSPVPFADSEFMKKVEEYIVVPTIQGLKSDSIDYKGFIFFGLINCNGLPFVIEYNVRMGDPETEVVMLRIESDFVDLLKGVAEGTLSKKQLIIDQRSAVTVFAVSGGYPEEFHIGEKITGLENVKNSILFHAGTMFSENNTLITSGGRVIAVSSYGQNKEEALELSYVNINKIHFQNKHYRKDIGFDI